MKKILVVFYSLTLLFLLGTPPTSADDADAILSLSETVSSISADPKALELVTLVSLYFPGVFTAAGGSATWTLGGTTYATGALTQAIMKAVGVVGNDVPPEEMNWIGRTGYQAKSIGRDLIGFGLEFDKYNYTWVYWGAACGCAR